MITLMLKSKYCCLITTFQRCCFTEKLKKIHIKKHITIFFLFRQQKKENSSVLESGYKNINSVQ